MIVHMPAPTDLVASNILGHVVQSLYYPQAKLLPLLIFCDRDVLDMAHETQVVNAEVAISLHVPMPQPLQPLLDLPPPCSLVLLQSTKTPPLLVPAS